MKKFFLSAAFALLCFGAFAQNVQLHYDFGHNAYKKEGGKDLRSRAYLTTTVEMFKPDSFGSTFFFVDMDYVSRNNPGTTRGVVGAYWEIARELCFWQGTKADWLSVHVEYNGGLNVNSKQTFKGSDFTDYLGGLSFNNAFLAGLTYSGHSKDFRRTWSISAMYKLIPKTYADLEKTQKDYHNFQITGVWGINFAKDWCTFSGFVDFWREARPWQGTKYIFLTEPQFWVNFNQIKGWENVHLSLGTEVEMSVNFAGKGFYAIPTLAAKWTF